MLWIVLIVGASAGALGGGLRALRLGWRGELQDASRVLRRSAWIAALFGIALTALTLGWPYKSVAVSVPDEVTRKVVEMVDVPVQVTRWFFFKRTEMQKQEVTKEVKETVYHTAARQEFSAWLLLPMAGAGLLCFLLEVGVVKLLWRFSPTGIAVMIVVGILVAIITLYFLDVISLGILGLSIAAFSVTAGLMVKVLTVLIGGSEGHTASPVPPGPA